MGNDLGTEQKYLQRRTQRELYPAQLRQLLLLQKRSNQISLTHDLDTGTGKRISLPRKGCSGLGQHNFNRKIHKVTGKRSAFTAHWPSSG